MLTVKEPRVGAAAVLQQHERAHHLLRGCPAVVTVLLPSVKHPLRPRHGDRIPSHTIFNPPARECDLVLSQILALGTPPSPGLQGDVAGIGAMPDVTVVTGEDDHPTGISGELQE